MKITILHCHWFFFFFQQMLFNCLSLHFFHIFLFTLFLNVPLLYKVWHFVIPCHQIVCVDVCFHWTLCCFPFLSLYLHLFFIAHSSLGWRTGWTGWTMLSMSCGITPWAPLPPCQVTSTTFWDKRTTGQFQPSAPVSLLLDWSPTEQHKW